MLPSHRQPTDHRWSKRSSSGDCIIGVVSLDPEWAQSGFVHLDAEALGLSAGDRFAVHDALDRRALHLGGRRELRQVGSRFDPSSPARARGHLVSQQTAARLEFLRERRIRRHLRRRGSVVQGRDHLRAARAGVLRLRTATAGATSGASRSTSTTSRTSGSPRSGSCRSIPRRSGTTATTSPTTRPPP